jgi:hypothetical protein
MVLLKAVIEKEVENTGKKKRKDILLNVLYSP